MFPSPLRQEMIWLLSSEQNLYQDGLFLLHFSFLPFHQTLTRPLCLDQASAGEQICSLVQPTSSPLLHRASEMGCLALTRFISEKMMLSDDIEEVNSL